MPVSGRSETMLLSRSLWKRLVECSVKWFSLFNVPEVVTGKLLLLSSLLL